ncbi:hypothetical protein K458DRAFT_419044 [Lentithecium fluviatile CBS 122367]|uniref:DUF7704 domain-containing protein n=1 Tax=Lentithecium fluviatile CBS 122367 TaxID=1168545 RepID=A0A6G1IZB9_9PLEO|nr:hypothetical protein K458DRAFT_419044 [Lentithecium fluviatile CBS 122367]
MAKSPSTWCPAFYRIFFTWLDPIICVWGAYMDFFDPTLVLSSHIPDLPHDIGHAMILRQRGGGMLNFGFISAVLLRYTTDTTIWRIVQFACLIVDFTYFWGAFGALSAQGRLAAATWRAEDWGAVAITGTATLVRVLFLMGVGLGSGKKAVKRS